MRSRPSKKRLDVQALRALAIVLVLVYHAFPTVVPGGFVGVDVFFVISGFLITLLLLRELQSTGRINLWSFYARRVRRLMPAALTTTVVTVAVAALLAGPVKLIAIVKDAMWTTAYLANLRFGMSPDGYFVGDEKSPLLHFWSLAVEEQFYLIWPLLLILLAAVAGARWRGSLPLLLVVILAGSLLASVVLTGSQWGHAYFSLATRAWELAIGAGVAVAVFSGVKLPVRHWAAAVGLLAVLWSAFGYSESTAFPGIAAVVPTVGTALLAWAGASGPVRYERAVGWRPIQFLGDVSYSLYLWHWPALILGRLVIGAGWVQSAALVLVSVLLAAASFYLLERRVSGL
ncbi:MAG TPA: acyltransferase, partial [Dermatophilaceae bacterium]|nr:acyltransferase [Dermatophilaceae bacterium]